jgi:hypothetical protein
MRAALIALCLGLFALAGQAHAWSANHPDRQVAQPAGRGPELHTVGNGGTGRRGGTVHRSLHEEVEGIHQMIHASRRSVQHEGVTNARERLRNLRSQALVEAERARTVHVRAQLDSQPPTEQEVRDPEEVAASRPAGPERPGPSGESDRTMGIDVLRSARSQHCHALALAGWIGPSPVECGRKDTDQHGRMVAVGPQMSVGLGTWMVRVGWALAHRTYSSHDLPQEASGTRSREF